jgi:hypothetical protein
LRSMKFPRLLAEASATRARRSRPSRRPRALPRPLSTAPAILLLPTAPRPARLGSAEIGLVGLDPTRERRPARGDHGAADLVQPAPGGLVAAEAHLALEFHRRDAALAGGHEPDRQKPARQAGLGLLEDGPRHVGVLPAAGGALQRQARPQPMAPAMPARRAAKALGPARPDQVIAALLVRPEPFEEARQVTRQIVRQHRIPPRWPPSPYPAASGTQA